MDEETESALMRAGAMIATLQQENAELRANGAVLKPRSLPGRAEVVTEYVRPPVPTTQWDWVAYISGDEEANGPTGRGATETEALRDLCEQLAGAFVDA